MPAAIASCGERMCSGWPSIRISPAPNGRAPKIVRASSVRPAPASPAKTTISPARAVKLMSFSAIRAFRARLLSLGGRQMFQRCFGINVQLDLLQALPRLLHERAAIDLLPAVDGLACREDVLGHAQQAEQAAFLVDDADPNGLRLAFVLDNNL